VLAVVPPGATVRADAVSSLVGQDRLTGLALVRQTGSPPPPTLALWSAEPAPTTRYLMAAESSPAGTALRPFLARGMFARPARGWRDQVWGLPASAGVAVGNIVFTTDAELMGMVMEDGGTTALVPAAVLMAEADRLLARGDRADGDLPIAVDAIAPGVARLLGVNTGVVVAWVDQSESSPVALEPGDVVRGANGQPVRTIDDWLVHAARLAADEEVRLRVVRGGQQRDVHLRAVAAPRSENQASEQERDDAGASPALGLEMRSVAGRGVVVDRVEPGSRGAAAGLRRATSSRGPGRPAHPLRRSCGARSTGGRCWCRSAGEHATTCWRSSRDRQRVVRDAFRGRDRSRGRAEPPACSPTGAGPGMAHRSGVPPPGALVTRSATPVALMILASCGLSIARPRRRLPRRGGDGARAAVTIVSVAAWMGVAVWLALLPGLPCPGGRGARPRRRRCPAAGRRRRT
jgi:S1-C subfamily serine protease